MDEMEENDGTINIQSGWNIDQRSLIFSKADIEEVENDLKKTGDWETYYERMFKKTGSDKYEKKLAELIVLKIELKEELKGASQTGFEEELVKVLSKRIKKDIDDQIAIEGARGGTLKIGDEEVKIEGASISVQSTGILKNDVVEEITKSKSIEMEIICPTKKLKKK